MKVGHGNIEGLSPLHPIAKPSCVMRKYKCYKSNQHNNPFGVWLFVGYTTNFVRTIRTWTPAMFCSFELINSHMQHEHEKVA